MSMMDELAFFRGLARNGLPLQHPQLNQVSRCWKLICPIAMDPTTVERLWDHSGKVTNLL